LYASSATMYSCTRNLGFPPRIIIPTSIHSLFYHSGLVKMAHLQLKQRGAQFRHNKIIKQKMKKNAILAQLN
jgi:hypothetical protein